MNEINPNQVTNNSGNNQILKLLSTLVVLLLAGFGFWKFNGSSSNTAPANTQANSSGQLTNNEPVNSTTSGQSSSSGQPTTQPTNPTNTPAVVNDRKSKYKDGSYSAVGEYMSPEGGEQINVTLVLKAGVITDASVAGGSGSRTSARYIDRFISGFRPFVIGKSIDSVSLTVINGSSLTPIGFMDALSKIQVEASA